MDYSFLNFHNLQKRLDSMYFYFFAHVKIKIPSTLLNNMFLMYNLKDTNYLMHLVCDGNLFH